MVDAEKTGAFVGALTRQLQAISGSGWTNVQTPVRQGFEAVEATAAGLAEQLAASREDLRRLEARLVGIEDMVRVQVSFAVRGGGHTMVRLELLTFTLYLDVWAGRRYVRMY